MKQYKEPVFLFTSCSLKFAAWAGWYSAFGDEENAEKWVHLKKRFAKILRSEFINYGGVKLYHFF